MHRTDRQRNTVERNAVFFTPYGKKLVLLFLMIVKSAVFIDRRYGMMLCKLRHGWRCLFVQRQIAPIFGIPWYRMKIKLKSASMNVLVDWMLILAWSALKGGSGYVDSWLGKAHQMHAPGDFVIYVHMCIIYTLICGVLLEWCRGGLTYPLSLQTSPCNMHLAAARL
jgi:hypothetical protein